VRILTVGRLLALKGHALLLQAVAGVRAAGAEVELTIVGDGPERERLEVLTRELAIEGHVRFAGAVGRDRVASHYAAADIFCLASFAEGVPVVLMEAMAAGLPVVATRVAGIPELIRDEETGLLVSPGRADLLAGALMRLVESEGLRRRLGGAGRGWVASEFDVGRSARQLQTILLDASQAPRVLMQSDGACLVA
jgi:glycosyltransferase involved in cell wall biosynthesis